MRTDVALYLNREVLEKVPFFQNGMSFLLCDRCSSKTLIFKPRDNFMKVLVRKLKPVVTAPSEFIIRYGDIGREMYFINRGVVVACSEDSKTIYSVLKDGSFFGEYALLFSQKRSASVKSLTYCDMFVLTQEDFQSVLSDFPEFSLLIRKEGIKRVVERIDLFIQFPPQLKNDLIQLLKPASVARGKIECRSIQH